MLAIAVCDDDQPFLQIVCQKIRHFFKAAQIAIEDTYFSQSRDLLREVTYGKRYDLVLLDIEMPGHSGLDIAKAVHEKLPNCLIAFLTSHSEYAIDAYELSVFRYIPKCELDRRLEPALTDALRILQIEENQSYIFKGINHGLLRVPYREIVYINKSNRNSYFHLLSQKVYAQRKPLKDVYEELCSEDFLLIDRGYIVNILHIMRLENGNAVCRDGTRIKISRPNLPVIQEQLCKYWSSNL
ncbi:MULTISPECIES: LytR/AlgR family response regulator transcription factor [Caproicibacterium]|uniref:Stage 0 sporulation protein A homolog n=1 Tax=Caproicibacterium argilliputei TaxID=3030016 RepID=A0AA97DA99_9FIRM|nr:LytTR family DNA-binding domain-containing protein [Caproicibacterium argilliputei]WOC33191.1 LytTR family DNA-binding domain-containing protein [Caproicibacterium argilliputei]